MPGFKSVYDDNTMYVLVNDNDTYRMVYHDGQTIWKYENPGAFMALRLVQEERDANRLRTPPEELVKRLDLMVHLMVRGSKA